MNKIYIIILFFAAILYGCEKSFLDKLPLDSISSNDYWKTTKDLELYLNQYYTSFTSYPSRGTIFWNDDNSDNEISMVYSQQLTGMQTIPASGGSWSFSNIRSINYFLTNYSTVKDSWENTRHYVGEAYFFKAFYYFSLLRTYGDVPWLTKPLNTDDPELYGVRTPRNAVADSIIANLDKAIAFMKPKPSAPVSRLNSDIALLLKSRVCLYEGTWEKYHTSSAFGVNNSNGQKYITLAAQASKALIDRGNYSIYNTGKANSDYGLLFKQVNLDNNPEIMLYKKYSIALDLYHYSQELLVWPYERGITKWMVDSYLCKDGLPISLSPLYKGDSGLKNVVANRDSRLSQCIWIPGDAIKIVGKDTLTKFSLPYIDKSGNSRDITGYMLKKGADPTIASSTSKCEIGAPSFRYAEALLNYAEAQAELGALTQSDIDLTINKLRSRAGVAPLILASIATDPNWDFPTLSPVINEVRRERRIELAFEGFRFNDLMRWKANQLFSNKRPKGAKFIQSDFPGLVIGSNIFVDTNGYIDPYQKLIPNGYGFIPGRNYLNPIPTIELTLNKNLVQNPGW